MQEKSSFPRASRGATVSRLPSFHSRLRLSYQLLRTKSHKLNLINYSVKRLKTLAHSSSPIHLWRRAIAVRFQCCSSQVTHRSLSPAPLLYQPFPHHWDSSFLDHCCSAQPGAAIATDTRVSATSSSNVVMPLLQDNK